MSETSGSGPAFNSASRSKPAPAYRWTAVARVPALSLPYVPGRTGKTAAQTSGLRWYDVSWCFVPVVAYLRQQPVLVEAGKRATGQGDRGTVAVKQ
ncbi:MAG TPA: hypothetical protein VGJ53_05385 [Micromonosporaceae bacterium]